ncbi:MAG TPA: aldose 1-epimerase [Vicinamibacterales bacterium]|nr:aldose 1-epimerase [Vicinamibacterales bacterium]
MLRAPPAVNPSAPHFVGATFLPGRGMQLFQVRAELPERGEVDLLHSPSLVEAARRMNGGDADWNGVASFSCGGAFLVPFANRVRGRLIPEEGLTIEAHVLGRRVRLPADWHGPEPGAELCAMHGLLLDARMDVAERADDRAAAVHHAGDFDGHWLSQTVVRIGASIRPQAIDLSVTASNAGDAPLPVGIGWHPYFALPSGRRDQARVHLPARTRVLVTDYDDVFPTGELRAVAGTPYDFTAAGGAPLGDRYFDDCFVDLQRSADGDARVEIYDPAAGYHARLIVLSPHVRALQLYAPPEQPFVVVEPQFNLADPFGAVWPPDVDTGMVVLAPGEDVTWAVRWELLLV